MPQKQESPAGDGAFEHLAWRLDASKYTRSPHGRQALAGPRQERQIERVHALGPRVLAEPHRVYRRLQLLRRWSYDETDLSEIFT